MTRSLRTIFNYRTILLSLAVMMASLVFVTACGDDEVATEACKFDVDCDPGTVCGAGGSCVTAACDFCTSEQICYKTAENPEGTCSAPQCSSPADCDGSPCVMGQCQTGGGTGNKCVTPADCPDPENQSCTLAGKCVDKPAAEKECENSTDCPVDGDICDSSNKCVAPPCTEGSCGDGKICGGDGKCADAPECDEELCETNERCLPSTGQCGIDCISDGTICTDGEMCDKATAQCVTNPCSHVAIDPGSCSGSTPYFSTDFCSCVQCTDSDQCGDGKACGANGQCTADQCANECDSNTPGTCDGAPGTPYCINDCCSECVGAADCSGGQLCLDGFCGNPPNCDADPTVCPQGYECVNSECKPPTTGANCSTDPTICPLGTFCNGSTCESVGGGDGCGLCNPDCTCPNGLSCEMGFMCTGCSAGSGLCPSGQFCDKVLTDSCLPCDDFGFLGALICLF